MITPPRDARFILCLLAGGRSSRFGASKLRIRLDGEAIAAWQRRRLLPAGNAFMHSECWINLAPGSAAPPGSEGCTRRIDDPAEYGGPLEGMLAVLRAAETYDVVAFVPIDMPALTPCDLEKLLAAVLADTATIGAMSKWSTGPSARVVEPFPSAWHAGPSVVLIEAAQSHGVRGPSGLSTFSGVACIDLKFPDDIAAWSSVNHREDLDAVAGTLGVTATVDE
ncbi:MAG: NTP transferase domain-containing protein [Planctomycetes bacterium]|nr:NTP transferase domain-containing protein [Planctomycetota bacterium]